MAEPLCVLFPNVKIETSSQTGSFIKLENELEKRRRTFDDEG